MSVTFTAMYPNTEGSNFDIDYYMNKHIPLVQKLWGNKLLKTQVVSDLPNPLTGDAPTYRVIAHLEVTNKTDLISLIEAHGKELGEDFPNYSDIKPVIQVSEITT